jgi:hypothetical protein
MGLALTEATTDPGSDLHSCIELVVPVGAVTVNVGILGLLLVTFDASVLRSTNGAPGAPAPSGLRNMAMEEWLFSTP